jgi:hypothetical protein
MALSEMLRALNAGGTALLIDMRRRCGHCGDSAVCRQAWRGLAKPPIHDVHFPQYVNQASLSALGDTPHGAIQPPRLEGDEAVGTTQNIKGEPMLDKMSIIPVKVGHLQTITTEPCIPLIS